MSRFGRVLGIGILLVVFLLATGSFSQTMHASAKAGAVAAETNKADTSDEADDSSVVTTKVPAAETQPVPPGSQFEPTIGTGSHWIIGNLSLSADGATDKVDWTVMEGALEPGLYASSFAGTDCSYGIHRLSPEGMELLAGSDRIQRGRLLVTLNGIEPDRFDSTAGCEGWVKWTPLPEPQTTAYNGDYGPGDLATGTWLVPRGCYWEEVIGFRGANVFDTVDSVFGPITMEVTDDSLGFRIRLCPSPPTWLNDLPT